jgi:NAD(P)-dependent dehydrogenase (short-subunit alcohol dehydrogenase family)
MNKKICIVTGASSGIGLETAKALAHQRFCVVMACRNIEKAKKIRDEIVMQTDNSDVIVMQLDLSSFGSIDSFVHEFNTEYNQLDVLINNAGTFCDRPYKTQEGFELTIGVNYIGSFYLTQSLLPNIRRANNARIINVSSIMGLVHKIKPGNWDFYDLAYGFKAYNTSKLAQILYTIDLAKELEDEDITVNALHPGVVGTNIMSGESFILRLINPIMKFLFCTPEKGAQTSIYLATCDEVQGITGKMFANKKVVNYNKSILDENLRAELIKATQRAINEVKECKSNMVI